MKRSVRNGIGLGMVMGGPILAAAVLKRTRPRKPPQRALGPAEDREELAHITAARSFNRSSAMLALSVLTDSTVEHYRASYRNPAMFTPLISSVLSLFAGVHGNADRKRRSHPVRHVIYGTAAAAGLAGTCFHLYNVTKHTGGWSWSNLFYGAPLGAPGSLLLSGGLGAVAERLRDNPDDEPRLFGFRAGKVLGLVAGAGLAITAAEAGLLHFRGSFQHKAMFAPVTIPPVTAVLLTAAALAPPGRRGWAKLWLRATTALGFIGMGFHIRGVARCHGGWRNWSQNVLTGPPIPAPPGFTALALAGLAALRLRQTEND